MLLIASLCPILWVCLASAQENQKATGESEKARVFITDSQSWSVFGSGGGSRGSYGSSMSGGARPQTAEIIKTFGQRCPEVTVNNIQQKTDYIVLLDHEGGKGALRHKNKVAVFARVSGDAIVSKSTLSLGGSVQDACEAINKDWAVHGPAMRAVAAAAPEESKPAVSPQPVVAAVAAPAAAVTGQLSATLEISSTPPDADIELDGSFAGNTPSSVGVEAGQHIIKISKNGFNPWERKIKSSTGTVRVSASLVPMQAVTSVPTSSAVIQQEDGVAKSAALISHEPPPSPTTTHDDPGVNAQAPKAEEVPSTAAPAKNNAMEAFLGLSSDEKKGERHDGVRIDGITPGGPADAAGLRLGDYILAIDNHYFFSVEELDSEVRSHKPGARVAVRYRRYSTIDEAFLIIGSGASTK